MFYIPSTGLVMMRVDREMWRTPTLWTCSPYRPEAASASSPPVLASLQASYYNYLCNSLFLTHWDGGLLLCPSPSPSLTPNPLRKRCQLPIFSHEDSHLYFCLICLYFTLLANIYFLLFFYICLLFYHLWNFSRLGGGAYYFITVYSVFIYSYPRRSNQHSTVGILYCTDDLLFKSIQIEYLYFIPIQL